MAVSEYYKKRHRPTTTEMFKEGRFTFIDLKVEPTSNNFKGSDPNEPIVCSEFGCRNHLTPEQQLYNSKCYKCQCK